MKQIKTINALVKEMVAREGLKKQVQVAQARELLGHLCDIYLEQLQVQTYGIAALVIENAVNRSKKKKKIKK